MEFHENRSKRPFIAFVWIAKTLRTGIASTVPAASEPDER
jgi:hypothetical protein